MQMSGDGGLAAGGSAGAAAGGASRGGSAGSGSDTGGVSTAGNAGSGGSSAGASSFYGGPSKCAGSTFQLCEDFESGTLDTATWTLSGKAPTCDGQHVARGAKAMHLLDPSGQLTKLTEKKTFREPNDTYYGRIFIYFKSMPMQTATFTYSHWTILAATGDGPGSGGEIRFGGQMLDGVNHWGTGTDNQKAGATGDWTNVDQDPTPDGTPAHVSLDTWMCMEWMHAGPDVNETKVWWDGVEHKSIATTITERGTKVSRAKPTSGMGDFILPNFTALWIGWQAYRESGQTFELWMDEVAVDSKRIGCEN